MPAWAIVLIVLGILGILGLVGLAMLWAVLGPVFPQARESARRAACMSNLKQASLAVLMYTQDYDGRYPPAAAWADLSQRTHPAVMVCPSVSPPGPSYAYNGVLDRRRERTVASPAAMPMLFESSAGRPNAADRLESFAPRHRGRGNVAYADGHVRGERTPPSATARLARPGARR